MIISPSRDPRYVLDEECEIKSDDEEVETDAASYSL